MRLQVRTACLSAAALLTVPHAFALPPTDWAIQFGTPLGETGVAVAVDRTGSVVVTGFSQGLDGAPSAGGTDVYLRKYTPQGTPQWTNEFGTANPFETGSELAIDSRNNVYLAAHVALSAPGGNSAAERNAYLGKFSDEGQLQWDRYIAGSYAGIGTGVAVAGPEQDILFTGHRQFAPPGSGADSQDGFVARFDADGNQRWLRDISTSRLDWVSDVAADTAGNAYVVGDTAGRLASTNRGLDDFFVQKYDVDGNLLWAHQDGTSGNDAASAIAISAGGDAYVTGTVANNSLTGGPAEGLDAYVRKFSSDGRVLWTRSLQLGGNDYGTGIAVGPDGLIYVSGQSSLAVGTLLFYGFYAVLNDAGDVQDVQVFDRRSELKDVSVNQSGDLAFAGTALASVFGPHAGFADVIVFKQTVVPEPPTLPLVGVAALFGLLGARLGGLSKPCINCLAFSGVEETSMTE